MNIIQQLQIITLKHVKNNSVNIIVIKKIIEIAINYQLSLNTTFYNFNQTFHNLLCLLKILLQKVYQIKFKAKSFKQFK